MLLSSILAQYTIYRFLCYTLPRGAHSSFYPAHLHRGRGDAEVELYTYISTEDQMPARGVTRDLSYL